MFSPAHSKGGFDFAEIAFRTVERLRRDEDAVLVSRELHNCRACINRNNRRRFLRLTKTDPVVAGRIRSTDIIIVGIVSILPADRDDVHGREQFMQKHESFRKTRDERFHGFQRQAASRIRWSRSLLHSSHAIVRYDHELRQPFEAPVNGSRFQRSIGDRACFPGARRSDDRKL